MENLSGKIVFITGSTDGLGKLVARRMAAKGATVLMHGRNPGKGSATLAEIRRLTGSEKLYYYNADLSSLEEVRELAESVASEHKHLNVLINNAGIGGGPQGNSKRELSKDGIELRFAVNYLSHFLLTYMLLPLIRSSAPSRIVNVSSIGQYPLDFKNLMLEKKYESFRAYRQSKLAQIMFTIDLAGELKGTGVTVNSLHPATLMNTKMVSEYFGTTMTSVEDGADALEYVATSEETAGFTGVYFDMERPSKPNAQAYDEDARRQLRELSMRLSGLDPTAVGRKSATPDKT